jgi:UDP-N-acetylglucosamine diphosphorylase / glucose-1-phosphate thymidylyltransferase / UDP-N-acetylgalactosamine diphosphorylase / glucosamine-1-phosphate N-acetyltransferase / galactosamine-1-phosphate N-acetyltransferase
MSAPQLIILAGGASSRMWPLREKSLIKFGEEPLLISQLRNYQKFGFTEIIIVGNPGNLDDIKSLLPSLPEGMNVQLTVQSDAKGMGDALLCAEPFIKDREAAVYINQVHDVVEDTLHEDMLKMYKSNPQTTYLAGVEMSKYFPGGYLIIDDSGYISGIKEKPGAGNEPSKFVNIVVHLHSHAGRLFDAVRHEYSLDIPSDDHYERAMDRLMKQTPYRVVGYGGRWDALKFPWHVLDIMERFLGRIKGQNIAPDAFVSPHATLVGDVFIGAGAKVFPGASVVGPAYIGKKVIVGNNSLVRHSMVLDNCNVGFTTEVARSYVADGSQMHACRVLDSVFGENVNFSAGCTTANLRIDKGDVPSVIKGNKVFSGRDKLGAIIGKDAFLGVDVMTMPGIKIGERANIGPGTHVHHDVKSGARVYVKQEIVIREE